MLEMIIDKSISIEEIKSREDSFSDLVNYMIQNQGDNFDVLYNILNFLITSSDVDNSIVLLEHLVSLVKDENMRNELITRIDELEKMELTEKQKECLRKI